MPTLALDVLTSKSLAWGTAHGAQGNLCSIGIYAGNAAATCDASSVLRRKMFSNVEGPCEELLGDVFGLTLGCFPN